MTERRWSYPSKAKQAEEAKRKKMARTKFRIKKEPVKPVRDKQMTHKVQIPYLGSLARLIELVLEVDPNAPFDSVKFEVEHCYDYYDESSEAWVEWEGEETDQHFDGRMRTYQTKLDNYLAWYTENQDRINEELKLRELDEKDSKVRKVAKMERDLEKLRRELK